MKPKHKIGDECPQCSSLICLDAPTEFLICGAWCGFAECSHCGEAQGMHVCIPKVVASLNTNDIFKNVVRDEVTNTLTDLYRRGIISIRGSTVPASNDFFNKNPVKQNGE